HGWQEFVTVAKVVFAELAGGVALVFQQLGNGRVFRLEALRGAREADLAQAGAKHALAGQEGRPTGRAALLAVRVGEAHALAGDAIDVGRAVAHQAVAVTAQVGNADVVAPDDENVWFPFFCHSDSSERKVLTAPMPSGTWREATQEYRGRG